MLRLTIFIALLGITFYFPVWFLFQPIHIPDSILDHNTTTYLDLLGCTTQRKIQLPTRKIYLNINEAGQRDGKLIIFLHGFPETGLVCWKHQIPYFAEKGYYVVAPDMRGYNTSWKSSNPNECNAVESAADISELITVLGRKSAIVVGHDWGGYVSWLMGTLYADQVEKLIILNLPHPAVMNVAQKYTWTQFKKSWYVFFFQIPWIPIWKIKKDNFAFLRSIAKTSNPKSFAVEDLQRLEEAWKQPGAVESMVAWYRFIGRKAITEKLWDKDVFESNGKSPFVEPETLILWGKNDVALDHRLVEPSAQMCKRGRVKMFEDATHWVQHDKPAEVNTEIYKFIST